MDDLIPRAEIFRSKLIEDFQLLNSFDNVSAETPKYYSNELIDTPECMKKMLKENPHCLVRFQVYTSKGELTYEDRRLNRVKTKNTIPLGPWARMIVENQYFQNFILILILINSIVLGIQAEITQMNDQSLQGLKLTLTIFDYLSMLVFILEILLKWVDEFWEFWRNGWNNFDFLVTIMSLLPELIKLASGDMATEELAVVAENLRVFRILRSLKMVSRFAQLRIIVLTILKAFKSMVFILTLLGVFMYIFAVAGTVMFSTKSQRTDLEYKDSFSSLGQSCATLFQLFTLDHWFDVLNDLTKVSNELTSKCYVILWICIGAFIFRNIFAGIMVMNFQNIRADFATQCNERDMEMEDETNEKLLEAELAVIHIRNSISDSRRQSVIHQLDPSKFTASNLPVIVENNSESETDEETPDNVTKTSPFTSTYNTTQNSSVVNKNQSMFNNQSHSNSKKPPVTASNIVSTSTSNMPNSQLNPIGSNASPPALVGPLENPPSAPIPSTVTHLSNQVPKIQPSGNKVVPLLNPLSHSNNSPQNNTGNNRLSDPANLVHVEPSTSQDPSPRKNPANNAPSFQKQPSPHINLTVQEMDVEHILSFSKSPEFPEAATWNNTVRLNLNNLSHNTKETLWPRDTLFRYYQLMEALQDNLAERHQLQRLLALAISNMHDKKGKNMTSFE